MGDLEKPGKKTEEQELEDEFSSVLKALGTEGDGSVLVWRFQTATEPHGFAMLARIPVRDFDPWTIGERFGGGRYRFDVMSSRNRYVKKAIERQIAPPPAVHGAASAGAAPLPGIDPISMLVSRAERADTFNQAIMLALIQNLGRTNAAPAAGMTVADMVAVMREARENAIVPTPPHATMLELLREGIGFGREIEGNPVAGDGESSGGALSMLPKFLDVLNRVLPAAAAPAAVAALPLPGPPGAAPGPGAASSTSAGDPVKALLSVFAPQIIAAASSGQDPTAFARFVVTATPRGPMLGALRSLVFATGEQRRLAFNAGASELVPYAEWIDRACDAARGFLTTAGPRPVAFRRAPPAAPLLQEEPPEVTVPIAAATDAEDLEDDEAGCDNENCADPQCTNPDHFEGCDDEACNDPQCNEPEHFDDEPSRAAAYARQQQEG